MTEIPPPDGPDRDFVIKMLGQLHGGGALYEWVLEELDQYDLRAVTGVLAGVLRHPDPRMRANAFEVMYHLNPDALPDHVDVLLADPDPSVRWHACSLLGSCEAAPDRVATRLLRVLAEDPEGHVRLEAVYGLKACGDPSALPGLRHAEAHDDGEDFEGRTVWSAARRAIREILERHPGAS